MGRRVAGTLEEGLIRVPRSRPERVAGIRSDASYVFSLIEADKDTEGSGTRGLLLDENGIRLYDGAGSTLQFTAIGASTSGGRAHDPGPEAIRQ